MWALEVTVEASFSEDNRPRWQQRARVRALPFHTHSVTTPLLVVYVVGCLLSLICNNGVKRIYEYYAPFFLRPMPNSAYPTPWGNRPSEPSVISLRNHFLPFE